MNIWPFSICATSSPSSRTPPKWLGATAALGVLNRKVAVTKERGQAISQTDGSRVLVAVLPACLLRLPGETDRVRERELFVLDLKRARALP